MSHFGVLIAFDTLSARRLTFGPSTTPLEPLSRYEEQSNAAKTQPQGGGIIPTDTTLNANLTCNLQQVLAERTKAKNGIDGCSFSILLSSF